MHSTLNLPQDYLEILKRRKWQFALPAAILLVVSALTAFLWPPTYQSSAIILIEEPDVPRDLVRSTVASFAAERIQVISQRVMTTNNILGLINKYGLYPERRKRAPISVVVDDMREAIGLKMINADVIDPRSRRPMAATIAFNLTFDHRRPATAQRVLNELVSLYLSENIRTREAQAEETTKFLIMESVRYGDLVSELEAKLAEFKEQHAGSLPAEFRVNLQFMERIDRDLLGLERHIQAREERKILLESQLTQVDPYAFIKVGGQILDPAYRLEVLQAQFLSLSGIYGPEHPDVRRLGREIETLKKEVGGTEDITMLEQTREVLLFELAEARERYSEAHPDILKLERRLESVEAGLSQARAKQAEPNSPRSPTNPAYIQLATQLEVLYSEMHATQDRRADLRERLRLYEKRIGETPQVEREYLLLRRDYDNAVATYREIKGKLRAAELGESLEEERKSERFSLIEPPTLPTQPTQPKRMVILFLGFVLSLAAGAGNATLYEVFDQSVYGPKQLAAVTGAAPLAVVPYITNRADIRRTRRRRTLLPLGSVLCLFLALFLINEYFLPLDVLWAKGERRMELLLIEIGII